MKAAKRKALNEQLNQMTEKQLRARARSLMRTANRRFESYRDYGKEGVRNLSLESLQKNLKAAGMYNEKTGKITMKGLDASGLKRLIMYQEELKEVETVTQYRKEVLKAYEENANIVPTDVLETVGTVEQITKKDPKTGKEIIDPKTGEPIVEEEIDLTDYDYLARAADAFKRRYKKNYEQLINERFVIGDFESRGDKLANIFTLFLKEYAGIEFTNEEIERMSEYEWEDMEKWSR